MKININLFPPEIKDTIKSYSFFKPKNKQELEDAIMSLHKSKRNSIRKHGHIGNWDTSLINDMSYLFFEKKKF